jgi:hypothetical protein
VVPARVIVPLEGLKLPPPAAAVVVYVKVSPELASSHILTVVVLDVIICAGTRISVIRGNVAVTPPKIGAMRILTESPCPVIVCTVVPVNI